MTFLTEKLEIRSKLHQSTWISWVSVLILSIQREQSWTCCFFRGHASGCIEWISSWICYGWRRQTRIYGQLLLSVVESLLIVSLKSRRIKLRDELLIQFFLILQDLGDGTESFIIDTCCWISYWWYCCISSSTCCCSCWRCWEQSSR